MTASLFEIGALTASPATVDALSEILVEAVAHGGSLSFLHPLSVEAARSFWTDSLAAASRDERVVLGARDGSLLVGTVTLLLDMPPNQPHRAEIAKMMTRVGHRGGGVAIALLRRAEALAVDRRKTLLVLDTAVEDGASALYEKCGFALSGVIPDFALKPHGGLTGTKIYWKRIGPGAR